MIDGEINLENLKKTMKKIQKKGFAHKTQDTLQISKENTDALLAVTKIPRELYIKKYGPTVGDRVRNLLISSPKI